MGIPVDQFLQVSCKFQLTSESELSESVLGNQERVRLCTSAELSKESTLIIMICSNEIGNNHIVAYYIEKAKPDDNDNFGDSDTKRPSGSIENSIKTNSPNFSDKQQILINGNSNIFNKHYSSTSDTDFIDHNISVTSGASSSPCKCGINQSDTRKASRKKPRVIVKQIFYHNYNEDIVAVSLSASGNKLVLVNASSTIYILPIKNILLNLDSVATKTKATKLFGDSLRPNSCGNFKTDFVTKVAHFYDAVIIECCQLDRPVSVVYWENQPKNNNMIGLSDNNSMVIVGGLDGELCFINIDEKKVINSTNLDEKIQSLKIIQDKFTYSLLINCYNFKQFKLSLDSMFKSQINPQLAPASQSLSLISRTSSSRNAISISIIKRNKNTRSNKHQVNSNVPDVVEIPLRSQIRGSTNHSSHSNLISEDDLNMIRRLSSLASDETIKQVVVSDRFLVIATSRDRCLVNSRNCCILKNSTPKSSMFEIDPLVKEVRFSSQEKILTLIKSPISNDKDNIIDSFLLVTTRSIYSIEARQSCRDMFIGLIDSHLGLRKQTETSRRSMSRHSSCSSLTTSHATNCHHHLHQRHRKLLNLNNNLYRQFNCLSSLSSVSLSRCSSSRLPSQCSFSDFGDLVGADCSGCNDISNGSISGNLDNEEDNNCCYQGERRNSECNLLINNFLNHRDELYERICYDSRAFSILFKLELNSLYEAYGDKMLLRRHFDLANRFFQMANFDHIKTIGKYIRLGAYKEMIHYVTNILSDENEILDEKERIDLSRAAFECLLAKTLIERSKTTIYQEKLERSKLIKLLSVASSIDGDSSFVPELSKQFEGHNIGLVDKSASNNMDYSPMLPVLFGLDPYHICEHTPKGGDRPKLSSNTIVAGGDSETESIAGITIKNANNVVDDEDDEGTLLANLNQFSHRSKLNLGYSGSANSRLSKYRLECEKSLINFVTNFVPQSLYSYALTQLIDFGLIDIADSLACSDVRVNSLIRILLRAKDQNRLIFRDGRFEKLMEKLIQYEYHDLVRFNEEKFLEVITAPKVTRALVSDTSLTAEYLGPHQRHIPQYSVAALLQLNEFRALVLNQKANQNHQQKSLLATNTHDNDKHQKYLFNKQQKQSIENIFMEFLRACLYESTGDSCRLWFNYINFYLNYVGSKTELQADIINLVEQNSTDCRLAITLYKAIEEDESELKKKSTSRNQINGNSISKQNASSSCWAISNSKNSPLDSMKVIYNLSQLFDNIFLVTLLEKTLLLVPQSADLDALSDCIGVNGLMGQVSLPVEHHWNKWVETIKTAVDTQTLDSSRLSNQEFDDCYLKNIF